MRDVTSWHIWHTHIRISYCSRETHQVICPMNIPIAPLSNYPSTRPQGNTDLLSTSQPKASWFLSFRQEVLSLCAWVGHEGKKTEQVQDDNIKDVSAVWLGDRLGGYHTACLGYTQEGDLRVSQGRSLSSSSTMKARSWDRGISGLTQPGSCYSYSGIPSLNGMIHLVPETQGN